MRRRTVTGVLAALALCVSTGVWSPGASAAASTSTAWTNGAFSVDAANLVREADIVLAGPNTAAQQSMPLGNGTLGAAVWAANGFTAQLNRADTLPSRKSPGWLQIPGLSQITDASDFSGVVDPYDGVLRESGGGMTATVYVRADKDELVVDVTGADPNAAQTATVNLWSGRTPTAAASGSVGTLAETWADNDATTGSGRTFGSLAALTAGGRNVSASVVDSQTVKVSFTPDSDGSFRVIVGSPQWTGGDAAATASTLLGSDASATSASLEAGHLAWWHSYWANLGLVKLSSADGTANYLEKLRTLYYFTTAEESRGPLPGSQAGVGDLFNFSKDTQNWYPAAYWFWNLRGQVAANIGAGASALNTGLFNLYTSNLADIQAWTRTYMGSSLPGICVPETMRFNGNGFQDDSSPFSDASCDQALSTWNGRTVSSGAEIGLWAWQQYLTTGDRNFLAANYPLMQQASEFLLAYTAVGTDGRRHAVANAHENQWNVQDPVNMIDAMKALFPATVAAARTLNTDASLVSQLQSAIGQIPDYPRTDAATRRQNLTVSADASGTDVLGQSSQPTAAVNNTENDDLEAVWPYGLIGDSSPLFSLAQRTYTHRVNVQQNDWSFDAVQAARLQLPSEVATDMTKLTQQYQAYPDGMGDLWGRTNETEPYIEQAANVALAVNESLVQDYDGVLRIDPAVPAGWDADGTEYIQGADTVSVQVHGGVIGTVGIHAGSTGSVTMRNPWPGQSVEVVDGTDESTVVLAPTTAAQFSIPTVAGTSYLVQPVAAPVSGMTFTQLTGTPATIVSHLGTVQIGVDRTGPTGPITGFNGLCVDDSGASTTNGNPVLVWDCSGAANQQWTVGPDGTLRTLGKCMDITGGATADGTKIELWDCDGGGNQVWQARTDGTLKNPQSGKCLDDSGSGPAGTQLIIWDCTASANQLWHLP
ncbi:RICIN domain-containing protein [Streptacidiphilus jiangxiensis]|uniref:Ricin-type beta-trefoil lectin domain-containing protein n=1 Tax=Streptacidiphilus jiangxiensis TaxID=235985 RepID=A0A1H7TTL1_STRJI|nr:RICIN domain-containing protein [Streptacidiphilus jiangxiensis]SEL87806.1 Ricin-type beta-trefoil lectin domain-containing protein [Streptacidiphilus jiangxiensis]